MQFRPLVVLVAATTFAPLVHATPPHQSSPQELGAAQGVLDFCARLDAEDGKAFEALGKRAFQGLSPQKTAEIRNSAPYTQAYAQLQGALGKLATTNARAACKALAPASHPDKEGVGRGK